MRLSHLGWTVIICVLFQTCSFEPYRQKRNVRKRAPPGSGTFRNQTIDPGETSRGFRRRPHRWPPHEHMALRQGYGPYFDRFDHDYTDRYDSYYPQKSDKFLGFLFIPLGFLIGIVGVYYFFQTYGTYFNTTSTGNATYYYYPSFFPFLGGGYGGGYGGYGGYGGGYGGGAAAVAQQQQQQQSSNNNNNNNDNNNNLAAVLAAIAAFNNVNFTGRSFVEPASFWRPLVGRLVHLYDDA